MRAQQTILIREDATLLGQLALAHRHVLFSLAELMLTVRDFTEASFVLSGPADARHHRGLGRFGGVRRQPDLSRSLYCRRRRRVGWHDRRVALWSGSRT